MGSLFGSSVRTKHLIRQQRVEDALRLFHKNDVVLGDLQDPNVFVSSENSVIILDFDWPGKSGENKYPATINTSNDLKDGVEKYGVMHKAHDLTEIEKVKGPEHFTSFSSCTYGLQSTRTVARSSTILTISSSSNYFSSFRLTHHIPSISTLKMP